MEKNYLVLDFVYFVSDVISKIGSWLMVPDLGPTARWKYFAQAFDRN